MEIKKSVENGDVVLRADGKDIARISAKLDSQCAKIVLDGKFGPAVDSYLENELGFLEVSEFPLIQFDCEKVEAIFPGCYLMLLEFKSRIECAGGKVQFLNKSKAILDYEKKIGSHL